MNKRISRCVLVICSIYFVCCNSTSNTHLQEEQSQGKKEICEEGNRSGGNDYQVLTKECVILTKIRDSFTNHGFSDVSGSTLWFKTDSSSHVYEIILKNVPQETDLSMLRKLKKLEDISISNTNLEEFQNTDLVGLKSLFLWEVLIRDTLDITKSYPNLQLLSIQQTKLRTIVFSKNNQLTHLFLKNNQYDHPDSLSDLLPTMGQLKHLQRLQLNGYQLSSLPVEVGNFKNLEDLDLRNNRLTDLPSEVQQLRKLSFLSLAENGDLNLERIFEKIGVLKSLEELWLGANGLTKLPKEIEKLQYVKKLALNINQLSNLPLEIGNLLELRELNLRENKLLYLPTEIGQLQNLEKLDLSHNQLSSLPSELGKLKHLKKLNLFNNSLSKEEQERISKLLPDCDIEF